MDVGVGKLSLPNALLLAELYNRFGVATPGGLSLTGPGPLPAEARFGFIVMNPPFQLPHQNNSKSVSWSPALGFTVESKKKMKSRLDLKREVHHLDSGSCLRTETVSAAP